MTSAMQKHGRGAAKARRLRRASVPAGIGHLRRHRATFNDQPPNPKETQCNPMIQS